MDEPWMNPAAFRNAGPLALTRDRAPSTSPRMLREDHPSNLSGWGPSRQELQVNPSIYSSPRPRQVDLEALRPARVDNSVKYYSLRSDTRRNENSEEEGVPSRLREYPLVTSRSIEYQDLNSKSSRILSPQDMIKQKNSYPPDNNESRPAQRPRKFSKLRGAFIQPEEHEPGSSSTGNMNSIVNRLPSNLSSRSSMLTSSRLINTANNQDGISVSEGASHQFTIHNPHNFPINNQGLAATHSGIVTNSGTHRGASKEHIPGYEEDESGELLVFDKAVFGYSTPNIFQACLKRDIKVLRLISTMFDRPVLQMTEAMFAKGYHRVFHFDKGKTKAKDFDKEAAATRTKDLKNHRRKSFHDSFKKLLENQEAWLTHWRKMTGIDFTPLAEEAEAYNESFQLRKLLITFLFYVEMINTIVPSRPNMKEEAGRELQEAAYFFKNYLLKGTSSDKRIVGKEDLKNQKKIRKNTDQDDFAEVVEDFPLTLNKSGIPDFTGESGIWNSGSLRGASGTKISLRKLKSVASDPDFQIDGKSSSEKEWG
ncbi:hypothetical protein PTTG_26350 [Puccinia triticina 1-1 BBBD Race 1]|uniref:Uncharacterized protein n=1 Tax=Puccinia triticina (isolate 1-1 / race 1 (BBBD)) TaxID=630390 RepID=A0A180GVQ0_PUCT1|nr:hypothetical protein PTTG_26350 [Puccinia triticina 1-1 BBBD Race 1]